MPGIVLGALCLTVLSYFHDIHMKLHYYIRHQKIEKVSEKESNLLTIPQYLSCTPFSKAKFSVLVKSLLLLYYSSSLPITMIAGINSILIIYISMSPTRLISLSCFIFLHRILSVRFQPEKQNQ